MNNSRVALAPAFVALVLSTSHFAAAQTTFVGPTNGTSQWTNTANWSGATVPDAIDQTVVFTNMAVSNGVQWQNTNITIGTINFQNASGNVVIGDNAVTTDTLTLHTSSGKPVLNVSNANSTAFIYASLLGTNGFTKSGAGNLTFRFNQTAMTYTGDINLNAGTLTINQDSSLGDTNNDIIVGGNSTLSYSPGGNTGAGSLSAGRNISISNGTTLTLQTLNTNTPLTINGVISNAGGLTFVGTGAGSNAATSLRYTLNGVNTYTGQTMIQGGARVTLGSGAALGAGSLTLTNAPGTTNPSFTLLDLGGNSQSVAALTVNSSTTNVRTLVISNGSLAVTAPSANFVFSGTNGSSLDMSGLSAFSFNGASNNRNFTLQPDLSTGGSILNTNYLYLAASGAGSNLISANTVLIGNASGSSAGPGNEARLVLGRTNAIHAQALNIGQFNASGVVDFGAGISNGVLKLRGSNGIAAMTNLLVGDMNSGSRRGTGILNLGVADALVTDTFIGQARANAVANLTQTNTISMAGGAFEGTNLIIGMGASALTGTSITNVSTFFQTGGTSAVTLIRMGDDRSNTNTVAYISTYAVSGPVTLLRAQTIDAGTNAAFGVNTVRTLQLSNGATLRNASGANLTVSGFTNTASGRMNIELAGNGTVEADTSRTVTFGDNTRLSGAGNLTKTGAGTLILSSGIAGANTGALNISNGVVQLNATSVAAAGTVTSVAVGSGATLLISQSDQVNNSAAVTLSGGTIARAGGVSETMGNLTLTANSFLDYGTGAIGTLTFGTYSPTLKLSVNNFLIGNVLRFTTDLSGSINNTSLFAFDNGFVSDWGTTTPGTFTITAIPEPSTYLAAAGLLGLMLWSARRRAR
jgi:autotransporter-associated beta strand protein